MRSPSPVESESDVRRDGSVTFAEILAGWSTVHVGGTGHGTVVLDKTVGWSTQTSQRKNEDGPREPENAYHA